jgi:hypothetical protein
MATMANCFYKSWRFITMAPWQSWLNHGVNHGNHVQQVATSGNMVTSGHKWQQGNKW